VGKKVSKIAINEGAIPGSVRPQPTPYYFKPRLCFFAIGIVPESDREKPLTRDSRLSFGAQLAIDVHPEFDKEIFQRTKTRLL
jgi:hypothetical protein